MKPMSLLLLGAFMISGCNYNKLHETTGAQGKLRADSLEKVDYAFVQNNVVGPKCLGCHSAATGNQGGTNLETLKNIRALLPRVAYRSLERRDMPPTGLSEQDLLILRTWIEQGAPEALVGPQESSAGDPTLEQGPNDWAKIRDRIFTAKCLDCHSGAEPQGGLDLTTLQAARAKAGVIFERVIIKGDMPMAPYPALAPRERRVLLKWFDLGMPE